MTATIYGLCHPQTGELRYIGKANKPRARLSSHMRDAAKDANTPCRRWVKKLMTAGLTPEMVVLEEGCADWDRAERRWIAKARGSSFRLLNISPGGAGPFCTPEARKRNGIAATRNRNPVVHRLLMLFGQNARWLDKHGRPEAAERLRYAQTRLRAMSPEAREMFAMEWAKKHATD